MVEVTNVLRNVGLVLRSVKVLSVLDGSEEPLLNVLQSRTNKSTQETHGRRGAKTHTVVRVSAVKASTVCNAEIGTEL